MPNQPSPAEDVHPKTLLLLEIVEVLTGELSAVSNREWEALPELKKRKVIMASRLREYEGPAGQMNEESPEVDRLKTLITELEGQSRQKIERHLDLIGNQIIALQELQQYGRESLNVSFRKFCEPMPMA